MTIPDAATASLPAPTVNELRSAWRALRAGQFQASASGWEPAGWGVLPVLGCAGGVGASTVALAIASAVEGPCQLVECCPPPASGFAAAATAELGVTGRWRRGSRGSVLLDRRADFDPDLPTPAACPTPVEVTVVDLPGWPTSGAGWAASLCRTADRLVLVTAATVPGMRRLDACLDQVDPARVVVAVVGPTRRQWARPVAAAAAPLSPAGWVMVPSDPHLYVTGLTPDPLPASLLQAGRTLATLTLTRKEPACP